MNTQEIIDIETKHTSGTYAKQPLVIVRGQGAHCSMRMARNISIVRRVTGLPISVTRTQKLPRRFISRPPR